MRIYFAQATSKTNRGGISKENCGHRPTLRSQKKLSVALEKQRT